MIISEPESRRRNKAKRERLSKPRIPLVVIVLVVGFIIAAPQGTRSGAQQIEDFPMLPAPLPPTTLSVPNINLPNPAPLYPDTHLKTDRIGSTVNSNSSPRGLSGSRSRGASTAAPQASTSQSETAGSAGGSSGHGNSGRSGGDSSEGPPQAGPPDGGSRTGSAAQPSPPPPSAPPPPPSPPVPQVKYYPPCGASGDSSSESDDSVEHTERPTVTLTSVEAESLGMAGTLIGDSLEGLELAGPLDPAVTGAATVLDVADSMESGAEYGVEKKTQRVQAELLYLTSDGARLHDLIGQMRALPRHSKHYRELRVQYNEIREHLRANVANMPSSSATNFLARAVMSDRGLEMRELEVAGTSLLVKGFSSAAGQAVAQELGIKEVVREKLDARLAAGLDRAAWARSDRLARRLGAIAEASPKSVIETVFTSEGWQAELTSSEYEDCKDQQVLLIPPAFAEPEAVELPEQGLHEMPQQRLEVQQRAVEVAAKLLAPLRLENFHAVAIHVAQLRRPIAPIPVVRSYVAPVPVVRSYVGAGRLRTCDEMSSCSQLKSIAATGIWPE